MIWDRETYPRIHTYSGFGHVCMRTLPVTEGRISGTNLKFNKKKEMGYTYIFKRRAGLNFHNSFIFKPQTHTHTL